MAKRTLTPRQQELQQALAELKAAKAAAAITRRRVAAARQVVDSLSRCDWCGNRVLATGLALQLCHRCKLEKMEQDRVALLARYGYDASGKRLPKAAA